MPLDTRAEVPAVPLSRHGNHLTCQQSLDILYQRTGAAGHSEENFKVYKNQHCAVCDEAEGGGGETGNSSGFSCYNPYFSHKSSQTGNTFVKL